MVSPDRDTGCRRGQSQGVACDIRGVARYTANKKIAREVCFVGLKTFILGLIWKSAPCPGPVCIVGLGLAVRGSAGLYSLGFRVSGFRFRV